MLTGSSLLRSTAVVDAEYGDLDYVSNHGAGYRIAADFESILRYFGKGGIQLAYLLSVLVKMRVGGESNRSLDRILRKSLEQYRARRSNGVGWLGSHLWKNLSKVGQFV